MKKLFISTIISLTLFIGFKTTANANTHFNDRIYTRAKIEKIEKEAQVDQQGMDLLITRIHLKIIDGYFKGETRVKVFKSRADNMPSEVAYKEGKTYFIWITRIDTTGEELLSMGDIDNTNSIFLLIGLIIISVVLVGRSRGFFSILALIATILLIFFLFVPWTLKGNPPLPMAIIVSILSIVITLPIISGFKRKTVSAILGASSGIIISSLLALFFGWIINISGIITHNMIKVFNITNVNIDLKNLSLSAMIIAALGAIMDIAVSISSSTAEIYNANPDLSSKKAFKSVLTIGQDILGSMVNTLILAYVGSSLSVILIVSIFNEQGIPFLMILNDNRILSEIVKSAIGSIGMFVTIPVTALIAVKLYGKKKK